MCSSKYNDDWLACPSCDQLYDLSELQDGEKARCTRCNHELTRCRSDGFMRVHVFALSALMFMVMSCSFPFLALNSKGLESVMTLPQAIEHLHSYGMTDLAVLVACFILIFPVTVLVLAWALGFSLSRGWRNYWAKDCAIIIFHLKNWSMVEVFLIGVLVSLVKIAHMAHVEIGISFWAYVAFTICFTMTLGHLDRYQTWKRVEELSR